MNWLWVAGATWVVLAVLTAVLIGRAIRDADLKEAGSSRRVDVPETSVPRDVPALLAARRAGPSGPHLRTRSAFSAMPSSAVAECISPAERTPAPRRSDSA
jgi:hypothetical protein